MLIISFQSMMAIKGRIYDECTDFSKVTWIGNIKILGANYTEWNSRQGDVYRFALEDQSSWCYAVYETPADVSKMIVDFYSPNGSRPTLAVKTATGYETKYVQGWANGMPTETSLGGNVYRYLLPKDLIPDGNIQGCLYLDANSDVEIMRVIVEYGGDYESADVNEGADYSRMEALMAKMATGKDITIAVIGGSMTAGANSEPFDPNFPNCYGNRIKHYLETKYGINVTFINAGIGSTNSFFGCIRAEEHILKYNPDLVLMEYAVNDTGDQESLNSYEGLMRKIYKAPGHPALFAVMMCTQAGIGCGNVQVPVAQYYKIPVVDYNSIIKEEIISATKSWADYYAISTNLNGDGVHPNTAGHQKVADIFEGICATLVPDAGKVISVDLPNPKYTSDLEDAFYVSEVTAQVEKIGTWVDGGSIWNFKTGKGWRSNVAGSELVFDFMGTKAAVTYWKRPSREGFGKAQVWVDNGSPIEIDGSNGEHIWQQILTATDNGTHKLHIKLLENKPFEVICVAFSGDRVLFNRQNLSVRSILDLSKELCFLNSKAILVSNGWPFEFKYTLDGYLCLNNAGYYLSVDLDNGNVQSSGLNNSSKFLYVDKGKGFALRSAVNGKYLSVSGDVLLANASEVTDNEIFNVYNYTGTSVSDNIAPSINVLGYYDGIKIINARGARLQIVNIQGQTVFNEVNVASDDMKISLAKGVYIVKIDNNVTKIIV